jgi:hypothetical protein
VNPAIGIVVSLIVMAIVPLIILAWLMPEAIPWGPRGRAARMLMAIETWCIGRHGIDMFYTMARGYFAAGDYRGVEGAYADARRIVDGEAGK